MNYKQFQEKYKGVPKSYAKNKEGCLYPNRNSYYTALKNYAKNRGISEITIINDWKLCFYDYLNERR